MKTASTALSVILLSTLATSPSQAACISDGFFLQVVEGDCSFAYVLESFETIFNNNPACATSDGPETELLNILQAPDYQAAETMFENLCDGAWSSYVANMNKVAFKDIARLGERFVKQFFNGKTDWNELVQTRFPTTTNGSPSFELSKQARQVAQFFTAEASFGQVIWPSVSNVNSCASNTAYCCWSTDRQAEDDNGDCEIPYDIECVDKDPEDNTNLCYVDLQNGASTIGQPGLKGTLHFPGDDEVEELENEEEPEEVEEPEEEEEPEGEEEEELEMEEDELEETRPSEGPIHCHGFAWADPSAGFPMDPSYQFRANNLFFVSMYDHLYQRGYVRNIPGAPMCACSEQMPVVSRADCTQIDPVLQYKVVFSGGRATVEFEMVELAFNSCEGIDPYGEEDDNDLWAYAHRLFLEGKMTAVQLKALTQRLVGTEPDACESASKKHFAQVGYVSS